MPFLSKLILSLRLALIALSVTASAHAQTFPSMPAPHQLTSGWGSAPLEQSWYFDHITDPTPATLTQLDSFADRIQAAGFTELFAATTVNVPGRQNPSTATISAVKMFRVKPGAYRYCYQLTFGQPHVVTYNGAFDSLPVGNVSSNVAPYYAASGGSIPAYAPPCELPGGLNGLKNWYDVDTAMTPLASSYAVRVVSAPNASYPVVWVQEDSFDAATRRSNVKVFVNVAKWALLTPSESDVIAVRTMLYVLGFGVNYQTFYDFPTSVQWPYMWSGTVRTYALGTLTALMQQKVNAARTVVSPSNGQTSNSLLKGWPTGSTTLPGYPIP